MTLAELGIRITACEQRCRYYDAAEGRQWFAERALAAVNEAELHLLQVTRRLLLEASRCTR